MEKFKLTCGAFGKYFCKEKTGKGIKKMFYLKTKNWGVNSLWCSESAVQIVWTEKPVFVAFKFEVNADLSPFLNNSIR